MELSRRPVRAGPYRRAGALAPLVDGVEVHVEVRFSVLVAHVLRERDDTLERLEGGFLGRLALPHELDDGVRAAGPEVPLAPAGRAARADLAVDEESGADDGRIAEAPRDLEKEPRGGRAARDRAVGGHRIAVDRALRAEVLDAVLLDVPLDVGVVGLLVAALDPVVLGRKLLFPVQPDLAAALREEVLLFEAVRLRELERARSDDEGAVGLVHHEPRDFRGVLDPLQRADRAALSGPPVHDRGVELDDALLVRDPSVADGDVVGIV